MEKVARWRHTHTRRTRVHALAPLEAANVTAPSLPLSVLDTEVLLHGGGCNTAWEIQPGGRYAAAPLNTFSCPTYLQKNKRLLVWKNILILLSVEAPDLDNCIADKPRIMGVPHSYKFIPIRATRDRMRAAVVECSFDKWTLQIIAV